MKRIISIILAIFIILSLSCCTPDNIESPNPDNNVQEGTESKPQTPENNQPESKPETEQKTSPNTDVMPSFDIDTLDSVKVKTTDMKDKELTLYIGASSFNAGSKKESAWLDAISEKLGLKINYKICSDSTLYSSQMIAQKTGKTIDIVSVKINDMSQSISLVKAANGLVQVSENNPFSSKVFEISGNKLFSAKAHAKALFYNSAIIKTAPENDWTLSEFEKLANDSKNAKFGVLETNSLIEFFSCGKEQITGFDASKGYIMNAKDPSARKILERVDKAIELTDEQAKDKKFARDNVAFAYTDLPLIKQGMTVNWLPLPKENEDGTNVMAFTGSSLGLSKTITEQNTDTAFSFIMLWCARYSESREDALRFDVGLSQASFEQYRDFCEKNGKIYCADMQIHGYFKNEGVWEKFYSDEFVFDEQNPDTVSLAYDKAALINARFQ